MEKSGYSQMELFSSPEGRASENTGRLSNPLLKYIRNYEKTILILIGFMITGIIAFSLGIERGKRGAVLSGHTPPAGIQPPLDIKEASSPKYRSEEPLIRKHAVIDAQGYTIQVASYKVRPLAQKEAQALKKKGYSSLLLAKNGYTILCVGNFSEREKAMPLLSELKKHYRDCLIRRL